MAKFYARFFYPPFLINNGFRLKEYCIFRVFDYITIIARNKPPVSLTFLKIIAV